MADGWVRATQMNVNNFGFFGRVRMITIQPGQTCLRAWWNVGMHFLVDDISVYPPGASILRVGVAYINFDTMPAVNVTPISDASADWMAITTMNVNTAILARATTNAWHLTWGFPIDLSIKSQRRNDTEDNFGLQLAYEFALEDEIAGFTIPGWWSSIDALVRTP
jgi:hypothetical protein